MSSLAFQFDIASKTPIAKEPPVNPMTAGSVMEAMMRMMVGTLAMTVPQTLTTGMDYYLLWWICD